MIISVTASRNRGAARRCARAARVAVTSHDGLSWAGWAAQAVGGMALSGLSWSTLMAAEPALDMPPPRRPLVVKPVFLYRVYKPRPQWSWRPWGGIINEQDAQEESARIGSELEQITKAADFSLQFLPLTATTNAAELAGREDVKSADVLLVYAHDGDLNAIAALQKDTIFFVRHTSGPLYLNYEIISPRFLRQHTDALAVKSIDYEDVVVDKPGRGRLAVAGPRGFAKHRGEQDPVRRRSRGVGPAGRRGTRFGAREMEARLGHDRLR